MSQGWHLKTLGWDLNFRSSVRSQPAGVMCPSGLSPWGLGDSEGHIECACLELEEAGRLSSRELAVPWGQWLRLERLGLVWHFPGFLSDGRVYSPSIGFPVGLMDLQWACVKEELTLLVVWILFFIKSTWLTEPKLPVFHRLYKMPEPEVLSRLGLSIALCLLTWMSLLLLDKLSGNIAELRREQ